MERKKMKGEEMEIVYVDIFFRIFDVKREMIWQLEEDVENK